MLPFAMSEAGAPKAGLTRPGLPGAVHQAGAGQVARRAQCLSRDRSSQRRMGEACGYHPGGESGLAGPPVCINGGPTLHQSLP